MRILAFSDLHRHEDRAERLAERSAEGGHIHQGWGGEAAIGTTPVVNVGPDGRFIDI